MQTREGRIAVAGETEAGFFRSAEYTTDFFGWLNTNAGAEENGYVAAGRFTRDEFDYAFREIGLLNSAGKRVVIRGEVRAEAAAELNPIVDAVLLSLDGDWTRPPRPSRELTASEAVERVRALPAVVLYEAESARQGTRVELEAEDTEGAWLVRMYAISDHFGARRVPLEHWSVEKETGAITRSI